MGVRVIVGGVVVVVAGVLVALGEVVTRALRRRVRDLGKRLDEVENGGGGGGGGRMGD